MLLGSVGMASVLMMSQRIDNNRHRCTRQAALKNAQRKLAIARPLFLFGTKGSWKAIFTATVFIGDEVFSKEWEDFPLRRLPKGNIGTGRKRRYSESLQRNHIFSSPRFAVSFKEFRKLVCNNVRHSSCATTFVIARVQQRSSWLVRNNRLCNKPIKSFAITFPQYHQRSSQLVCNNVRHSSCATTFVIARVQQRSSWLVRNNRLCNKPIKSFAITFPQYHQRSSQLVCNNVRHSSCATTFVIARVQQRSSWLVRNNRLCNKPIKSFAITFPQYHQRSSQLVCNNVRHSSCATTFVTARVQTFVIARVQQRLS
ncbi:hypothetical protein CEXT_536021 [Caerostris extrusa]|uniref:Uncharacterized protein n=1 Tax=Caerostris extrusa TaxID=172846 RepID=A0AAV4QK63_CAEEX|nr:hypothetical protein CEXT_536021 [Caerostris extrusa]